MSRDETRGRLVERLHVEHQDPDAARDQQIADLVRGKHVPEPAGGSHPFAQGMQECLVGGQYDQLDDVAREAEAQRGQRTALILGR